MLAERTWSREQQAQQARSQIWRLVSPAGARSPQVLPLAAALLALPRRDTRFLTSLHLLLSPECTDLLHHAPTLLRHLTTSTTAPLEEHPERVRGPIDWQATLALSASRGRRAYATRPPERDYATPENRLLVASLRAVQDAERALGWKPSKDGISQEASSKATAAARLLGAPVLRRVVEQPHPRDLHRVEHGRAARRFHPVTGFWRLFDRLHRLQDQTLLREMVESTAVLTTSDGALLEALVLFQVLGSLQERQWQPAALGLVRGQVVIRHTRAADTLDVHYQGVPAGMPSRYSRVLNQHAVPTGGLRPDLVLDHRSPHTRRTITVVEVKYRARAADAVRDALFDLLAYRDTYRGTVANLHLLGVAWGAGLSAVPAADVLLCTIDRLHEAVATLDDLASMSIAASQGHRGLSANAESASGTVT